MDKKTLSSEFSLELFKKLVTGLVDTELYSESKEVRYDSTLIKDVSNIGHFLNNRFQNILLIKHVATSAARVKLTSDTFRLMANNNIDKALVAYVSESDEKEWSRQVRFLQQRGFTPEQIFACVNRPRR